MKRGYRYGLLAKGSSDYIGIGRTGRFIAVELKRDGKNVQWEEGQQSFLDTVNSKGGLGVMVQSGVQLIQYLRKNGEIL